MRNLYFEDTIEVIDDKTLNFYMVPCFNVDTAFGTFVETAENDHVLNIYANYDMQRQQVCDALEITLYGSGIEDQSLTYHLNAAQCVPRRRARVGGLCAFRVPAERRTRQKPENRTSRLRAA